MIYIYIYIYMYTGKKGEEMQEALQAVGGEVAELEGQEADLLAQLASVQASLSAARARKVCRSLPAKPFPSHHATSSHLVAGLLHMHARSVVLSLPNPYLLIMQHIQIL